MIKEIEEFIENRSAESLKSLWDENYAQEHGLTLTGFSYEMIISGNVTDRMEDYIVQIEVPICS